MKNKKIHTKDTFNCVITFGFIFLFIFLPFQMFGQNEFDSIAQLREMKEDYRKWLSRKSVADMLVEYDPSPVALDISKHRFN